jgi:hypothetical protein
MPIVSSSVRRHLVPLERRITRKKTLLSKKDKKKFIFHFWSFLVSCQFRLLHGEKVKKTLLFWAPKSCFIWFHLTRIPLFISNETKTKNHFLICFLCTSNMKKSARKPSVPPQIRVLHYYYNPPCTVILYLVCLMAIFFSFSVLSCIVLFNPHPSRTYLYIPVFSNLQMMHRDGMLQVLTAIEMLGLLGSYVICTLTFALTPNLTLSSLNA